MIQFQIMILNNACKLFICNLSLSYEVDGTFSLILDRLNITIEPRETIVILGPSGCGKTTLLRILAGLLSSSHPNVKMTGNVEVNNMSPHENTMGSGAEYLFQNPVLLPWLNVIQNITLPSKIRETPFDVEDIKAALATTGLEGYEKYYPAQLSGGMKQRVALARAFAGRHGLLLMDEPFGSLDEKSREEMDIALLKYLGEWSSTVVFVTHNVREAALLGDKILIMTKKPSKIVSLIEGLPKDKRLASDKIDFLRNIEQRCREALGFSIFV